MKKNILSIILIFAMIGCVSEGLRQTYGDEWMEANSDWRKDDKKDENTSATTEPIYVSTAKVFSQTVAFSTIDTAWGGSSDKPVFSIYMLKSDAVDKIALCNDPKNMPKGYPCFRIQIKGNLSFPTPLNIYNAFGVYDNIAMEYIDCLAVTFDEHGYVTLYLDKTKISALSPSNCKFITVYGKDMPNGEGTLEDYCNQYGDVDWFQLIPCTVAFAPTNALYRKIGRFDGSLADLIMMTEAGGNEFPHSKETPELHIPYTPNAINYIIGTVIGSWTAEDATHDNLDPEGCYYYTATVSAVESFKYIIAGNGYDYQFGVEEEVILNLNSDIPLIQNTNTANISFEAVENVTYRIHYWVDNTTNTPYCRIEEYHE